MRKSIIPSAGPAQPPPGSVPSQTPPSPPPDRPRTALALADVTLPPLPVFPSIDLSLPKRATSLPPPQRPESPKQERRSTSRGCGDIPLRLIRDYGPGEGVNGSGDGAFLDPPFLENPMANQATDGTRDTYYACGSSGEQSGEASAEGASAEGRSAEGRMSTSSIGLTGPFTTTNKITRTFPVEDYKPRNNLGFAYNRTLPPRIDIPVRGSGGYVHANESTFSL